MEDYLSIQEFANLSGVDASTLRYWDSIGIFSPMLRNPENNYRYYSISQILALNFVTTLSDLEIPLKTIAELRRDRDPDQLLELLEKQEKKMDMEMRALRLRYSIIHARRELINCGVKADETLMSVQARDEETMYLWPPNEYREGDTFLRPLAEKVTETRERHINLSFPVGGYHDSMDSFKKEPGRPNRFISIDPLGTHRRKAGKYLTGYARGGYGELGDLPDRMLAYAKDNAISVSGPVYTIYLREEISTADPKEYLAQCSVAVGRKA